ncbi:MAG: hypothetical protein L6435_18700, partial [Anaerolineae bacterium]|nr:hypothetical protein [Anaerolineae bacterium]
MCRVGPGVFFRLRGRYVVLAFSSRPDEALDEPAGARLVALARAVMLFTLPQASVMLQHPNLT